MAGGEGAGARQGHYGRPRARARRVRPRRKVRLADISRRYLAPPAGGLLGPRDNRTTLLAHYFGIWGPGRILIFNLKNKAEFCRLHGPNTNKSYRGWGLNKFGVLK